MDKYTVDLDKVLDEFEQNEDELAAFRSVKPSTDSYTDPPTLRNSSPIVDTNESQPSRYDYPFEPMEKLDLAEADFAASLKTCEKLNLQTVETGEKENIVSNGSPIANGTKLVETIENYGKENNSDTRNFSPPRDFSEKEISKTTTTSNLVENNLISLNPEPTRKLAKVNNDDRNRIKPTNDEHEPKMVEKIAVGFADVEVTEADLEEHLKEAEIESIVEEKTTPSKSTEDSSSGDEFFSPLGETKTPIYDTPDKPFDRSDVGLHRIKKNKENLILFDSKPKPIEKMGENSKKSDPKETKKISDEPTNEVSEIPEEKLKDESNDDDTEEDEETDEAGAPNRRPRPTTLMLSETNLMDGEPGLDFPTPANPKFTDESSLIDDPIISVGEEPDCNSVWKESTDSRPLTDTPDWHGAEDFQLGKMAPFWIPDSDASVCMHCNVKFTVLKRRHHCRACGLVLCSQCCAAKAKLEFMDNREARVCNQCHLLLKKAESPVMASAPLASPCVQPISRPNPNNPIEYCSTISPLQQVKANPQAPLPTIMVPVGVLKREGFKTKGAGEPKQVMFSDGIRPGGDLTELDQFEEPKPVYRRPARVQKKIERNVDCGLSRGSPVHSTRLPELPLHLSHYIPEEEMLYPPIIFNDENGLESVDTNPDPTTLYEKINAKDPQFKFAINKNLFVTAKLVALQCCLGKLCWCFSTKGMCNVAQDEIVIVLECLSGEKVIPKDIFYHLSSVYDDASHGIVISDLGCSIFNHAFLSSRDHGGFLYIKPTTQCLQLLPVPDSSFLIGILLQKWEIPWAKVFPLRLMLRLGAEFHSYPCPIISCRFRKPVFYEIGHTIMNILADFRNYQYTLPNIRGMKIHLKNKKTRIRFPRNRYDDVMRSLNNSNDHVLAIGSNFSSEAAWHLICIQYEDGSYHTQPNDSTLNSIGASFVVFSGALKSSSGYVAKMSIVEDGIMVQIPPDKMAELRQSLRDMHDTVITCGPVDAETNEEEVYVEWVQDDKEFNIGIKSPIDNTSMDGIQSIRIHGGTDYAGERWLIRWTEVFLIQTDELINSRRSEPVNISRLSEKLAQAFCMALTTHLENLKMANMTKLALRATIDSENVGYEVGSNGDKLPSMYMNDLDSHLIPVIHRAVSTTQEGPVTLELIFHILQQ